MNCALSPETLAPRTGSEAGGKSNYRGLVTAVLLALAAITMHLPSIQYGFAYYDDVRVLRDHPELYGQPDLRANLRSIFVTAFPREEPLLLRDVTWALDSGWFGFGNPFGYHLGNVLLHGVVVAVLFGFLLTTTRQYGSSLAIAIGYLVLAVHTEPVAWIMGRKDLLSTLFMLLALWAQTRRLTCPSIAARCGWYLATVLLLVCGLLSKISVLTFPFVLFLHAIFLPYVRGESAPEAPLSYGRNLFREGLLLLPNLALSGLTYIWYQRTLEQMGIFERGYTTRGLGHLWNLLIVDPMVFWSYVSHIFFPWRLSVLYTWPTLQPTYAGSEILASLITVVSLGAIGIWLFRQRKDLFFYFAAFFVLMVPYVNLIYMGIWVADRYVYFTAMFLIAIAVSLGVSALQRPEAVLRITVITASILVLGTNLYQKLSYQKVWRDAEGLWEYHIALPNPSPAAYENLAAYHYAVAVAHVNTPEMDIAMRKMSVVVDAGLKQFWLKREETPPRATWYLFFLQSITQEIEGKPKDARESLLMSDRLRPEFDATNLNLARLDRRLAQNATDPAEKGAYAREAQDRFTTYIRVALRGRPTPVELQGELDAMKAEYAQLSQPGSASLAKPSESIGAATGER